ncbi:MAG: DMT family transporter [Fimbriimonadaceae bacterium]|nr:DMT family transporter [Fimbriimonadaceae bacterium]
MMEYWRITAMDERLPWVTVCWSLGCAALLIASNILTKLSLAAGRGWLMVVVYGCAALGYAFFRKVTVSAGVARGEALIGSLITLFTVAIGVFILRETITLKQAIGLVLIAVGIVLIS